MDHSSFNPLPSPTWNWLRVNHTQLRVNGPFTGPSTPVLTEGVCTISDEPQSWHIPSSGGPDFDTFIRAAVPSADAFDVPRGGYLLLRDDLTAADRNIARRLVVHAQENSRLILISRQMTESAGTAAIAESVSIQAEAGSHITYVQIVDTGRENRVYTSLGIEAGAQAQIETTQIVLSAGSAAIGGLTDLLGEQSSLDCAIAYQCKADHVLDMNWIIPHHGKKTDSRIAVSGVLRDLARKTFRGTIDFRRGSAGATGSETEDVLLLSETVQNQTVPVILCEEEDVSGTHGASIGRLSEGTLYYMQSRGLSEAEIYRILAKARLAAGIRRIPDAATQAWLRRRLGDDPSDSSPA
ncbi:MAG: SufD family Fe-S cluster assembly protein [Clostridia bacterium]|nr:SufD family Fe-S cluster assembly protein [Clostridia bacterium]